MNLIFSKNIITLKILWDYTKELKEEDKNFQSEKGFFDSPARVYQEATLIMLLASKNSSSDQLKLYEIMRSNSDEYALAPFVTPTAKDYDAPLDIEKARKDLANMNNPDYASDWLKENTAIVAQIPHLETIGLQKIITNYSSYDEVSQYFQRFDKLIELYSDPRIKNNLLQTWILFDVSKIVSFEEKLKKLFDSIINNPSQIEQINLSHEKYIFLNTLIRQVSLRENNIYLYFDTFLKDLMKNKVSGRNIYTFINAAILALHLLNVFYKKDDLINGDKYYKFIFHIGTAFYLGIPPEILHLGWDASKIRLDYIDKVNV